MRVEPIKYQVENKEFIIREAAVDDAEQLLNHINTVRHETIFLKRKADELCLSIEDEINYIKKKSSDEMSLFLVVETASKIIATLGIEGNTKKRFCHKVSFGIAIQQQYWGLKLGQRLIECMIDWAKRKDIIKITLHVDTENIRAIHLYKKMGFEVEGVLKKDTRLADGSFRDVYEMALFLDH